MSGRCRPSTHRLDLVLVLVRIRDMEASLDWMDLVVVLLRINDTGALLGCVASTYLQGVNCRA